MPTSDERLLAMLIYLVSLFFPVLGPLIIFLLKREESDFVDYHGKEYLNFFLSYTIYTIISGILVLLLVGVLLLIIVGVAAFVFTVIAMVKSYNGEEYRIPFVIHFIK
ncbi:DUF4870 domain-containing protein [Salimicrobium flavidum]|uniref:DUF4870 domain-containing protein n=1 Tax=Salimicrobium flavidum TaxID=570947 RepID=A0A1N7IN96_9BACI|nr:DUF4870 domain-containing protein [Salimicrobium flavidum]SIS38544.1 hypothetical protein SAMN05421687_101621 [Salimicrobium flavidum]